MGEEKVRAQRGDVVGMLVLSMGFVTWYICSNWMGAYSYDVPAWWFSKSLWFLPALPCAWALYTWCGKRSPRLMRGGDICAGFVQIAAIVLCAAGVARSVPLAAAATFAFGVAASWLMVRWSVCYACASERDAAGAFIGALVAIACEKMLVALGGSVFATAVAVAAPVLSVALLQKDAEGEEKPASSFVYTGEAIASLWRMGVAVAVFFFVWSGLNASLKHAAGHYSFGAHVDVGLVVASYVLLAIVALFLYWWMFVRARRLDVTMTWRIVFVLVAVGLCLSITCGVVKPLQAITGPAAVIGELLLWLALVDIARQSPYATATIVLVGFLLYLVPDAVARAFVGGAPWADAYQTFASASLLAIVVALAFFVSDRSPDAERLLSGAHGGEPAAGAAPNDIDATCHRIATEKGLSEREEEVFRLLCRGRSRPYIAEALVISENTVRSHVKHIYQKLDVHSKQDLIDLVNA